MTGTALVLRDEQTEWTADQMAVLEQAGVEEGVTKAELKAFLHTCQRTGLDPFSRQIYLIGRHDSRKGRKVYTPQTSIDGLRIIAQRSHEYAGQDGPFWCGDDGAWTDVWLEAKPPRAAKVGVWRQGFTAPLYSVARWESYAQTFKDGNPMGLWGKMPDLMIAKCAEALALRKAFPNDLSGIYTAEEMAQADKQPAPVSDGTPRNANGTPSRRQATSEQLAAAGVMTHEQQKEHSEVVRGAPKSDRKAERTTTPAKVDELTTPAPKTDWPPFSVTDWMTRIDLAANADDLKSLSDELAHAYTSRDIDDLTFRGCVEAGKIRKARIAEVA